MITNGLQLDSVVSPADYGLKSIGKLSFQTMIKSTSLFKKSVIHIDGSSIDLFTTRNTEYYVKRKIKQLQKN